MVTQPSDAGDVVTRYPVIAEPPFDGATHDTEIVVLPGAAATELGADGVVAGVTAGDAGDADDQPTALRATTLNAYDVPLFSDSIEHDVSADPTTHVNP